MWYNPLLLVCPDTCCSIYNHPHLSRNANQHKWVSERFLMTIVPMYITIMLLYLPVHICLIASTSMCWIQFVLMDSIQCPWRSCFMLKQSYKFIYNSFGKSWLHLSFVTNMFLALVSNIFALSYHYWAISVLILWLGLPPLKLFMVILYQ